MKKSLLVLLLSTSILGIQSPTHSQSGVFQICNKMPVQNAFTLVDEDYQDEDNYMLEPGECWDYWEYEKIRFYDNYNKLKVYEVYPGRVYYFDRRGNGAVDLFYTS